MSVVEFEYKLTPRVERILVAASHEATKRGHEYIGTEHVFWALMADADAVPTQILEGLGVRASAVEQVEQVIANSVSTDLAVDREGNVIGHMSIGPNGKARIVDDDGNEVQPHN